MRAQYTNAMIGSVNTKLLPCRVQALYRCPPTVQSTHTLETEWVVKAVGVGSAIAGFQPMNQFMSSAEGTGDPACFLPATTPAITMHPCGTLNVSEREAKDPWVAH